jgi:hypothetical protein
MRADPGEPEETVQQQNNSKHFDIPGGLSWQISLVKFRDHRLLQIFL